MSTGKHDMLIITAGTFFLVVVLVFALRESWRAFKADTEPKITFSLVNYNGETESIIPTCVKVRIEQSGAESEATCWRDNGDEVTLTGGRFYAQPEQ